MKNLRFFSLVITLISLFAVTSCKYVDVTEPPVVSPNNNEMLKISVSGSNSGVVTVGDTIFVTKGTAVGFKASFNGRTIRNLVWSFADDQSTSTSINPIHQFNLSPPAVTTVTVTGVDSLNVIRTGSATIKMVYSLSNLPAVIPISSVSAGNGLFTTVIAINKDVLKNVPGSGFSYKGDITQWQTFTTVASADTNWLVVGNSLVAPTQGEVGRYFVIRSTIPLGTYKIGTSRPANGVLWGTFWGEYALPNNLMGFQLVSDSGGAKVVPIGTSAPNNSLPGEIQDSVICFSSGAKLLIFVNKKSSFSGIEFIRLQDSNGVFQPLILESSVPNFPNWGMVEIPWSSIPTKNSVVFVFGPDRRSPNVYSGNMSSSIFFNHNYRVLEAVIASVHGSMAVQVPRVTGALER